MNDAGRIGFLIKGEYSAAATYDFLDIVFYGGASYVAKKITKGNTPARSNEYWQIFAEGTTISDVSDASITFNQAANRINVSSGDKLSVFAGKVKKFFADLKSVAFTGNYADLSDKPELKSVATSGNYEDLSNKPTIPTVPDSLKNPKALTFTGSVTGSYDGSAAKSVAIPSGTDNLLATIAGTWLDAKQGKVLDDKITALLNQLNAINSNLRGFRFYGSLSELGIDSSTMTYQDFVDKMNINSMLVCAVPSVNSFIPINNSTLTVICTGPDNGSRRYIFEAVAMYGATDTIYRARYSSPAGTKWTGWRRVEMTSI